VETEKKSINTRFLHTTTAKLYVITDAERSRMQAYRDALHKAMIEITEFDADRVRDAIAAVAKAHPIDDALCQAFRDELDKELISPLESIDHALDCDFLKPDAPWGMVVYRVSYGDNTAWERILALINEDVKEASGKPRDRLDVLARHQLVVMNDRSQFDGATPDQVRKHFTNWAVDELRRNWREPPMPDNEVPEIEPGSRFTVDSSAGTRYNFCLLVDDICLESLDKMCNPVVKLVTKYWTAGEQDLECEEEDEGENPGYEGGVSDSEFEDVGWMYKNVSEYVDIQNDFHDPWNWADDYVRPPIMGWESEFESAPGFWRRKGKSSDGQ
jgi:hypothetical protein